MSLKDNHDIWKNNALTSYVQAPTERSLLMVDLIKECRVANPRILELGCNVGRNLEFLRLAGFEKLTGIEINPHAVEAMKEHYPDLDAKIITDSFERRLPIIADDKYDIVFTMAVLMHIHPASENLFDHVARIAGKYLVIIENEGYSSGGTKKGLWNARDYKRIFSGLGLHQIMERALGDICKHNDWMTPYKARVFMKIKYEVTHGS